VDRLPLIHRQTKVAVVEPCSTKLNKSAAVMFLAQETKQLAVAAELLASIHQSFWDQQSAAEIRRLMIYSKAAATHPL